MQRQAAAEALNALTPEVVEKLRRQEQERLTAPTLDPDLELEPVEDYEEPADPFAESLRQQVIEAHEARNTIPEHLGIGAFLFQWILLPGEDGGLTLGLEVRVDDREPVGLDLDITEEDLAKWSKGKGLQGNRVQHKQWVSAVLNTAVGAGLTETGNSLIWHLEHYMAEGLSEGFPHPAAFEPTRTSVGEDEPFADAPENAGEVPE
jgi:hypothetical protein